MKPKANLLYALMHQSFHIPKFKIKMDRHLDPNLLPNLEMTAGFAGIDCVTKEHCFTIPYLNFQIIFWEKESKEPAAQLKKAA